MHPFGRTFRRLALLSVCLSFACNRPQPPEAKTAAPAAERWTAGASDWRATAQAILDGREQAPQPLLDRGRAMAERHCAVCHAPVPPEALPKRGWFDAFEQLHSSLQISGPASAATEAAARRFVEPAGALAGYRIAPEEFAAAVAYYMTKAPAQSLPVTNAVPRGDGPAPFAIATSAAAAGPTVITLARFEPATRRIVLGDGAAAGLTVLTRTGKVERRIPLGGSPTGLTVHGGELLVTLIGLTMDPAEATNGKLVSLPAGALTSRGPAREKVLLSGLRRPVHTQVVDLDGDGRDEYLIEEFGLSQGSLALYRLDAKGAAVKTALTERSGSVGAVVADYDHDGRKDVVALLGQSDEGLSLFKNLGGLRFEERRISRDHPSYGYTALASADVDGDGLDDLIATNGDNLDLKSRPAKAFHGVRLWKNMGDGTFRLTAFLPFDGPFQTLPRDFDGDGDIDLAVIAFCPDFGDDPIETFVYFENRGGSFLSQRVPGLERGRWVAADAGDFDGDGDQDLVLGAAYLPLHEAQWVERYGDAPRLAYVLLENTTVRRTRK